MKKVAAEKRPVPIPTPEELDNSEEIQPIPNDGYGDKVNIVVPIRDDLSQIILAQLEDDLRWNKAIVGNGCANEAPSWTGRVKQASLTIKSIEKKIEDLKAEMEKEWKRMDCE